MPAAPARSARGRRRAAAAAPRAAQRRRPPRPARPGRRRRPRGVTSPAPRLGCRRRCSAPRRRPSACSASGRLGSTRQQLAGPVRSDRARRRCARPAGPRRAPGSASGRRRPGRGTRTGPARGTPATRSPAGRRRRRAADPAPARPRVDVEQHDQVGLEAAGRPGGQPGDLLDRQRAAGALVGQRRVDVPVADHHRAAGQRRAHDGGHVVGPVGGVEQRLGARRRRVAPCPSTRPRIRGADVGRAGLAGDHDVAALRRAAPSASAVDLGATCRRPRRPRRPRTCRCRANGSAGDERAAADRAPQVGQHRHAGLVVHLPERADAGADADDARRPAAAAGSRRRRRTEVADRRRGASRRGRPGTPDSEMASISTTRVPICTTAKTRPRTSSSTSPPSSVVPARNAMPGAGADQQRAEQRHGQVDGHAPGTSPSRRPARCSCRTSAAGTASRTTIGPSPMPSARPMKSVAKSREKAASPAPSERGEELGRADHDAAAGERAEDAEHQAADQRGPADVLPALDELPRACSCSAFALLALCARAADLLDAEEHDQRGGEAGERVEVERELDRLGPVGQAVERAARRSRSSAARPGRRGPA